MGEMEVYMNASEDDLKYLHTLAVEQLLEHDMFPYKILSKASVCDFHQMPEGIQWFKYKFIIQMERK